MRINRKERQGKVGNCGWESRKDRAIPVRTCWPQKAQEAQGGEAYTKKTQNEFLWLLCFFVAFLVFGCGFAVVCSPRSLRYSTSDFGIRSLAREIREKTRNKNNIVAGRTERIPFVSFGGGINLCPFVVNRSNPPVYACQKAPKNTFFQK
jgi:hypothetical protein